MVIIRDAIKSILKYLSKSNAADSDKKWSVRYSSQKPLHGLLFLPSSSRGSQSDLWLNNHDTGPAPFSSPGPRIHQSERRRGFEWRRRGRKLTNSFRDCLCESCLCACVSVSLWTRKSSVDSDDEEAVGGARPMTPLVLTSWEELGKEEGGASFGLPTPEERTRRHAQNVTADIVPINVTGESFDRQASLSRSLSHRDSLRLPQRSRTGSDYSLDQTRTGYSLDQTGYSVDQVRPDLLKPTTARPCRPDLDLDQDLDHDLDQDLDLEAWSRSEPRRIRAPRSDLSSLMETLTSSRRLHQETPADSATYRAIYYTPADAQSDGGSSASLEPWSYRALTPSSSRLSAQDEGWSCEPLLSSPSHCSLGSASSCCSQTSLHHTAKMAAAPTSSAEEMAASSSLNFLQSSLSSASCAIMSASSSLTSLPCRDSCRSPSSASVSLSESFVSESFASESSSRRLSESSSSSSRSFSLRKNKCPPAPPPRNESLRRRVKRRSLERRTKVTPPPENTPPTEATPPAAIDDPWVKRKRSPTRKRSGVSGGGVTTFEPRDEEQNTTTSSTTAQRVPSPSSGYSSQSNTPLSSPASPSPPGPTPSSPGSALLPGPASPSPPGPTPSSPGSALLRGPASPSPGPTPSSPSPTPPLPGPAPSFPNPRLKSAKSKPRPPERTSSLLRSPFSSSSSLSSVETPAPPPPPPPPPLPAFHHQLPVVSKSPQSDVVSNRPGAAFSFHIAPPDTTLARPLPPPPPPLPPPTPLPDYNRSPSGSSPQSHSPSSSSRRRPNSASPAFSPNSASSPPLPPRSALPPPPPPPAMPRPPPLVTAQALRNVQLRNVKSHELTRTNSLPTMETNERLLQKKTASSAHSVHEPETDICAKQTDPEPGLFHDVAETSLQENAAESHVFRTNVEETKREMSEKQLRKAVFASQTKISNCVEESPDSEASKPTQSLESHVFGTNIAEIKINQGQFEQEMSKNEQRKSTLGQTEISNICVKESPDSVIGNDFLKSLDKMFDKNVAQSLGPNVAETKTEMNENEERKAVIASQTENTNETEESPDSEVELPKPTQSLDQRFSEIFAERLVFGPNVTETKANPSEFEPEIRENEQIKAALASQIEMTIVCVKESPDSVICYDFLKSLDKRFDKNVAESLVFSPNVAETKLEMSKNEQSKAVFVSQTEIYKESPDSEAPKPRERSDDAWRSSLSEIEKVLEELDAYVEASDEDLSPAESRDDFYITQRFNPEETRESLVWRSQEEQLEEHHTSQSFNPEETRESLVWRSQEEQLEEHHTSQSFNPEETRESLVWRSQEEQLEEHHTSQSFNPEETRESLVWRSQEEQLEEHHTSQSFNPEETRESLVWRSQEEQLEEDQLEEEQLEADLEAILTTEEARSVNRDHNELKMCRKFVAAEIKGSDFKVQRAQVTDVERHELKATESCFRGDETQSFTEDLESLGKSGVFKERNRAYLDMYALLAQSTASRPPQKPTRKSKSKATAPYFDVTQFGDDVKSEESVSDGPWVKKQQNLLDSEAEESPYWSLCRADLKQKDKKEEVLPGNESGFCEVRSSPSEVKPTLPKKPDLGILTLLDRTKRTEEKRTPENSPRRNPDSPRRDKPPIPLKKPTLSKSKLTELENMQSGGDVWTARRNEDEPNALENCKMSSGFTEESLEKSARGLLWETWSKSGRTSGNCGQVWTPASFESYSLERNDREEDLVSRFQANNSLSWIENLENLGSYRRRAAPNAVNSSANVSSPRIAERRREFVEEVKNSRGFLDEARFETREENEQVQSHKDHDVEGNARSLRSGFEQFGKKMIFIQDHGEVSTVQAESFPNVQSRENQTDHGMGLKMQKTIEQNALVPRQNSQSAWKVQDSARGFCSVRNDSHRFQSLAESANVWQRNDASVRRSAVSRRRDMRSSLAEDDELEMEETMKKTARRRKKPSGRLLMKPTTETFSSSSSSLSSSDSEGGASEETRLKGELSLPDLLIQEPGEEDTDVFGAVEADHVTVASQTRSTDDLFAVIHRSKRKMFGRNDSSMFSRPVTPDPRPAAPRHVTPPTLGFKALLLKKGGHLGSKRRLSAVERLLLRRPRPQTPPASSTRWSSPRPRLFATPMAPILERREEEDEAEKADGDNADGDEADGDEADGDGADGDEADGDKADGDSADGDSADRDKADGADGDEADGHKADGADGDEADGDGADGNRDGADGDEADGDGADGNRDEADGHKADGHKADGADGDEADGDEADGDGADGNRDGADGDGADGNRDGADGDEDTFVF